MTGKPSTTLPGAKCALALLLCINLFNYIDRQVLAAVEPEIRKTFFPIGSIDAEIKAGLLATVLCVNPFDFIDQQMLAAPESEIRKTFFAIEDVNAKASTGFLATAFLLSYMLLAPVFGWLADRISRWQIICFGVIVWSMASAASGLAATFTLLLITRLFVGVGEAAYGPAAPTIISDHFPLKVRGRVMSLFYLAIPVGSALGYVLGGAVNAHYGWRWAFYLVMPPGILLGVLCLFMKDPRGSQPKSAGQKKPRIGKAEYLHLLKTPSYVFNTLAMTAMTFAIGGMAFWAPTYINEYRHYSTLDHVNSVFGMITVIAGLIATLLGGVVGDRLTRRFPGAYFLSSGAGMLIAVPFTVAFLYVPFPSAWGMLFMAIFFLFFNTGPSNTALANVTHPSVRSAAFALNIFIIHALGDAISPPLIGKISGLYNMNVAFLFMAGVMFCASLLWFLGAKYLGRDTAAIANSPNAAGDTAPSH